MPSNRRGEAGQSPPPGRRPLREQEAVWSDLLKLASGMEAMLHTSLRVLCEGRPDLAAEVEEQERSIDRSEVRIEQECMRILALFDPLASDLRLMAGALKIGKELERMADLALRIAKRARKVAKAPEPLPIPGPLVDLTRKAMEVTREGLVALNNLDAGASYAVIARVGEVERCYRSVRKGLKESLRQDPERFDGWLRLIDIARNLGRIADHAAYIAEDIVYIKEGRIIRHADDRSSPS